MVLWSVNAVRHGLQTTLCGLAVLFGSGIAAKLSAGSPPPSVLSAQQPQPLPEWIGTPQLRSTAGRVAAAEPAVLETVLKLPADMRQARVEAIADFADVQLLINGRSAGRLEPFAAVAQWDVTPWLQTGENRLALSARSTGGPAAVALRLTWHDSEHRPHTLVTDGRWRSGTSGAVSYGRVQRVLWMGDREPIALSPLEDYTQWKRALNPDQPTEPSTFVTPPDFEVQLLHTAEPEQGSWVAMAFDPQGRLTIAREQRGLLRLSLNTAGTAIDRVELIDDSLEECRGLLYHDGALYANANNSKTLFRLTDTDGDGRFDSRDALYAAGGGVGHGRNALALGPERQLYTIHGDSVELPRDFRDLTSPAREHARGAATSEGHLLQIRRDGKPNVIIAAGLRNPFGLDFNADGEAFTYDADAEHDMGAPWYRATRVNHLIAGADFGWRGVTGNWPPYYPDHCDNTPAVLEVGRGSPTAVKFASGNHFPPPYDDALYILDWAYGRVMAVQMEPRGSSYACLGETFLQGRPLNVTGLDFGPRGEMYLITGGRKTQSALYRVRYVGPTREADVPTPQLQARRAHAAGARDERRKLETLLAQQSAAALAAAWPALADADPWLRHVARTLLEHQPPADWADRALQEQQLPIATTALLALGRCDALTYGTAIAQRLASLPLSALAPREQMAVLYTAWLCLQAHPEDAAVQASLRELLDGQYPSGAVAGEQRRQWDLWASRILVQLAPQDAVPATVQLLRDSGDDQQQQMHYLFVLSTASQGWTDEARRLYFRRLNDANQFTGGAGMPQFLDHIRRQAVATLSDQQRASLADVLQADAPQQPAAPAPRKLVRHWTLEELENLLAQSNRADQPLTREQSTAWGEQGRRLFVDAQCAMCHRFADQGHPLGPDLTHLARRFSPRDLLQSILRPSEVIAEPYRNVQIMTQQGHVHVGRVLTGGDFRDSAVRLLTDPMRPHQVTQIDKQTITEYQDSPLSPMPDGLLDVLSADEILALLAYLTSDPSSAAVP